MSSGQMQVGPSPLALTVAARLGQPSNVLLSALGRRCACTLGSNLCQICPKLRAVALRRHPKRPNFHMPRAAGKWKGQMLGRLYPRRRRMGLRLHDLWLLSQ